MFLITVRMSFPDLHPDTRLEKQYGLACLKDAADWWHAFKRACEAAGWRKMASNVPTTDELRRQGLERQMYLASATSGKSISVTIDVLEPKTGHEAAKLFTL